jgi:hypothetical protein
MNRKKILALAPILLGLLAAPASPAPHTHAHGKGELELTVQGDAIRAIFRTPMDSLLGFEHAPKTDSQRAATERLRAKLSNPDTFFLPTPAAQCTPSSSEATSTLFSGQVSGSHSDLEYRFSFKCTTIGALKGLDAVLFADYPRLHEIRAVVVTDKGQRSILLKKRNRIIAIN